jgi:hypothetical protein
MINGRSVALFGSCTGVARTHYRDLNRSGLAWQHGLPCNRNLFIMVPSVLVTLTSINFCFWSWLVSWSSSHAIGYGKLLKRRLSIV